MLHIDSVNFILAGCLPGGEMRGEFKKGFIASTIDIDELKKDAL